MGSPSPPVCTETPMPIPRYFAPMLPSSHLLLVALACLATAVGCNSEPSAPGAQDNSCPDGVSYSCHIVGCGKARSYCMNGSPGECTCLPVFQDAAVRRDGDVPTTATDAAMQDASTLVDASGTGGTIDAGNTGGTIIADSGTTQVEICDNGVDDDGDGETDCSDEDCTTRTCVDNVPEDWQGPVVLGESDTDAPACSGPFSELVQEGGAELSVSSAQCSGCQCSAGTCATGLSLSLGTSTNCSAQGDSTTYNPSACASLDTTGAASDSEVQVALLPVAGATSCTPGTSALMGASPSFGTQVRTCALNTTPIRGGCERGRVCAPKPEGGFGQDVCILRQGDHPCPSGDYANRHLFYEGISDTRSCAPCDCSDGCSYEVTLFDEADSTCQNPVVTLTEDTQCGAITPVAAAIRRTVSIQDSRGCGNSGGQASGAATGIEPFTVCCL